METGAIVEPSSPAEIEAAVTLLTAQLREHGIETRPDELRTTLRFVVERPEFGFALLASVDGLPVGVAYASSIASLEHGGWSGWLEELYLLPDWRGRGIGSRLLEAVVGAARNRGWIAIDLEVDREHERVIPLYARHRFTPVARTRYVRRISAETSKNLSPG